MKQILKKVLLSIFTVIIGMANWGGVHAEETSNQVSGKYSIVVEGYDWGPSVSKAIVELETAITEIDMLDLAVVETKTWYGGEQQFDRKVTDAYLSDANGNKTTGSSKYFTVELYVSPNDGVPFVYDMTVFLNNWAEKYELAISLVQDATVTDGTNVYNSLNIDPTFTKRIKPQADLFDKSEFTANGITFSYASYVPESDDVKNPLIIWFHGGGEGGSDTDITLLANKVTAFASQEDQEIFGGAYVLVPQCPTMWIPDWNNGEKTNNASPFTESIMALIEDYVATHPDVDTNRIYLSGCSAGGYMSLNLVFHNPDYFAAAFVTCAAYKSSWETDSAIESIKDVPIWFVYAATDSLNYNEMSVPLYERLVEAGAKNVHITEFDKVVDTSGLYKSADGTTPYEYHGHFSWIYLHNNEVIENGITIKEWAASQSLLNSASTDTTAAGAVASTEDIPKTGVTEPILPFAICLFISILGIVVIARKKTVKNHN